MKNKPAHKPAPKQSLSVPSSSGTRSNKPPRKKTEAFLAKVVRRRQRRLADAKNTGNLGKAEALTKALSK